MTNIKLPELKVWKYFLELSKIPRPSKKEQKVKSWLVSIAKQQGLKYQFDNVGNLKISKPAQNSSSQKIVILQSHLDMVTVKSKNSTHDFEKDPLKLEVEDSWLTAKETTLGSDNGIGVCQILAILEDQKISHPEIEAIFTVDEEDGMSGAFGLEKGFLQGDILLNFDSEEDQKLFIASAGGKEIRVKTQFLQQQKQGTFLKLAISNLKGGHSGLEINLGRLNAIQSLSSILLEIGIPFNILKLEGGQATNAIPDSAEIEIYVEPNSLQKFKQLWSEKTKAYQQLWNFAEKEMQFDLKEFSQNLAQVFLESDSQKILQTLIAVPQGVLAVSQTIVGLVQTSNNLGILRTKDNFITFEFLVRSSLDPEIESVTDKILKIFELTLQEDLKYTPFQENQKIQTSKTTIWIDQRGFSWSENPDSQIINNFQQAHQELFGAKAKLDAIHAGLECSIIKKVLKPNSQAISFGPEIQDAHTPREKVLIASVTNFDKLTKKLLQKL